MQLVGGTHQIRKLQQYEEPQEWLRTDDENVVHNGKLVAQIQVIEAMLKAGLVNGGRRITGWRSLAILSIPTNRPIPDKQFGHLTGELQVKFSGDFC